MAYAQVPIAPPPVKVSIGAPVDVPMDTTTHVPVIEVKINGQGPYRFAFDTGFGGMVEILPALAQELALPTVGEMMVGDPSGRNPHSVHLLGVESFAVGSAHFSDVSISEGGRVNPGHADGVIGLRLFRGLLVQLDYVHNRFVLREGTLPAKTGTAYTAEHGVPTIEIDMNGAKMHVDLDSGSPALLSLPLSAANSLRLAAKPAVKGHGRTADGEFDVLGATLNGQVQIGSITLSNPALDFVSVFPNGHLGYGFFKDLAVTFDVTDRRVMFEQSSPSGPR